MAHHTHWDSYPHEGFFDELIGDDKAPPDPSSPA